MDIIEYKMINSMASLYNINTRCFSGNERFYHVAKFSNGERIMRPFEPLYLFYFHYLWCITTHLSYYTPCPMGLATISPS